MIWGFACCSYDGNFLLEGRNSLDPILSRHYNTFVVCTFVHWVSVTLLIKRRVGFGHETLPRLLIDLGSRHHFSHLNTTTLARPIEVPDST